MLWGKFHTGNVVTIPPESDDYEWYVSRLTYLMREWNPFVHRGPRAMKELSELLFVVIGDFGCGHLDKYGRRLSSPWSRETLDWIADRSVYRREFCKVIKRPIAAMSLLAEALGGLENAEGSVGFYRSKISDLRKSRSVEEERNGANGTYARNEVVAIIEAFADQDYLATLDLDGMKDAELISVAEQSIDRANLMFASYRERLGILGTLELGIGGLCNLPDPRSQCNI